MNTEEETLVESVEKDALEAAQKNRNERDEHLSKSVMRCAANLVRESNFLPRLGENFELYNSYPTYAAFMEQQQIRVQTMLNKVMQCSGVASRMPKQMNDIDLCVDRIISAGDSLVERAGVLLDELERAHRNEEVVVPKTIVGAESTKKNTLFKTFSPNIGSSLAARLKSASEDAIAARNVSIGPKPQKKYNLESHIDNSRNPFVSKLKVKHNARERKERDGITIYDEDDTMSRWVNSDVEDVQHPYQYELDHFIIPDKQLLIADPIMYEDFDKTPLVFVSTLEGLHELKDILNKTDIFAVDLEAHVHRSFLGLCCLMQISTRHSDYIIDPFPIWEHICILNEPFTNPNILKVFHGGDGDIRWLQRDFGIFVVNMFDTYKAMRRLEYGKLSLQYLVFKQCSLTLSKRHQLSDWRLRPLPEDMLKYARGDTHYLLYCYDNLRNELIRSGNEMNNLLNAVYKDSSLLCAQVYSKKPEFNPEGYQDLIGARRNLNNRQIYALSELWRWRDETARTEDESINYVLPSHMMIHIAEALPREMQGILACCSPVPLMVKDRLLELHRIVCTARDQPLLPTITVHKAAAEHQKILLENMIDKANRMTKIKSLIRSHLDFSHTRFDEEIGIVNLIETDESIVEKRLIESFLEVLGVSTEISTLQDVQSKEVDHTKVDKIMKRIDDWPTPYERYRVAVKEAARKAKEEEERIKREGVPETGQKTYSHHDQTVCRKPEFKEQDINVDNISLAGEEKSSFDENMVLTKKALKRKAQLARKGATDLDGNPSYTVKMSKQEVEMEDSDGEVEEIDYNKYDKDMFNKPQKKADSFDPFHQEYRIENKKNGRKRGKGGMHRMNTQSVGYNPSGGGNGQSTSRGGGGGGRGRAGGSRGRARPY